MVIATVAGIIAACALCGAFWTHRAHADSDRSTSVSSGEFALILGVVALIVTPIVVLVVARVSVASQVSYTETLHGYEVAAAVVMTECHRDGSCQHTYSCDPYQDCHNVTVCRGSGDSRSCSTERRCTTKYHSCPYSSREYRYSIATTLGDYTYANGRLPENPQSHRFRKRKAVPESVIRSAGVGEPQDWLVAKARIHAGRPGPVSKHHRYPNYILASERTILKTHSSAIDQMRAILPSINHDILGYYDADRVEIVGRVAVDREALNAAVMRFNAAFGDLRQGDLHLVIVSDSLVDNPDAYALALRAYWGSSVEFEKHALPKNAYVVVLGVDSDQRVAWARGFGGMPIGHEVLSARLNEIAGTSLSADSLFGGYAYRGVPERVSVGKPTGALEKLLVDQDGGFRRVSMSGDGPDDVGSGYLYLKGEIEPSAAALLIGFLVVLVFANALWFFAVQDDVLSYIPFRRSI